MDHFLNSCNFASLQVAASPAVSAAGTTAVTTAASAEGASLPTLQHGRGARHRRTRDGQPALSTVPEVRC